MAAEKVESVRLTRWRGRELCLSNSRFFRTKGCFYSVFFKRRSVIYRCCPDLVSIDDTVRRGDAACGSSAAATS